METQALQNDWDVLSRRKYHLNSVACFLLSVLIKITKRASKAEVWILHDRLNCHQNANAVYVNLYKFIDTFFSITFYTTKHVSKGSTKNWQYLIQKTRVVLITFCSNSTAALQIKAR